MDTKRSRTYRRMLLALLCCGNSLWALEDALLLPQDILYHHLLPFLRSSEWDCFARTKKSHKELAHKWLQKERLPYVHTVLQRFHEVTLQGMKLTKHHSTKKYPNLRKLQDPTVSSTNFTEKAKQRANETGKCYFVFEPSEDETYNAFIIGPCRWLFFCDERSAVPRTTFIENILAHTSCSLVDIRLREKTMTTGKFCYRFFSQPEKSCEVDDKNMSQEAFLEEYAGQKIFIHPGDSNIERALYLIEEWNGIDPRDFSKLAFFNTDGFVDFIKEQPKQKDSL